MFFTIRGLRTSGIRTWVFPVDFMTGKNLVGLVKILENSQKTKKIISHH